MSTDPSQTQLEIDLACLATLSGASPSEVAAVAVRNLLLSACYGLGREGNRAGLDKLLLMPSLNERLKHAVPPKGGSDYLKAEESAATPEHGTKTILDAARARTTPFSSKQLAEELGLSGARVGQTLTSHRWPRMKQPEGSEVSTWLPQMKEDISVMESK